MTQLITELSSVMQKEIRGLAQVAQNTANINSTGYKSQRVGLHMEGSANFMNLINQVQMSKGHDTRVAGVQATSNKTDLALLSDGWFSVKKGDELLLTRNGAFSVNSDGFLTTKTGDFVQGLNGNISGLTTSDISINQRGDIFMGNDQVATLAIYDGPKNQQLESKGDSLYQTTDDLQLSQSPKVTQGSLESSNVDSSAEMLRIVESTRHIETMQRAMASYDELLKIGITQIGK